jgi:hypothetical protein
VIAALVYLLNPVSYAEYLLFPHLLIPDDIAQTVQNIGAHPKLFARHLLLFGELRRRYRARLGSLRAAGSAE